MSSCWWVSKKNEFEYKLYSCKYIHHKEDLIISTMKTSTVLHDSLRSLLEIWVGLKGLWKTFEGALQPGRVLSRVFPLPLRFSHSLHSSYSDGDMVELSSSTASPNFSHLSAAFLNVQSDEVEDLWRSHVSKVMADSTAINVISTCQIFPRLYKVWWLSRF